MPKNAKRGLGKGLDALIAPKSAEAADKDAAAEIAAAAADRMISIYKIEPNREQPRQKFDEDTLQELADSIRQVGVLEPLLVKDNGEYFEIIAGERRWRAAKLAGLKEVPVVVRNDLTPQQIVEIQLIENIQRQDLNPIEEALGYRRLITEFQLKQDEIAERVSKSRVAITNSMRLLKLCGDVQQMVIDGLLTTGHARALIPVENEAMQYQLAQRVFDEALSVRETEKLVRGLDKAPRRKKTAERNESLEAVYRELEEKCRQALGTKVKILPGDGGMGKLEIDFYSGDDLEKITDRLLR